jgi:hypothetical protein
MGKGKERGKNEIEGGKWGTRRQMEEKNSIEGKSRRREQRQRARK